MNISIKKILYLILHITTGILFTLATFTFCLAASAQLTSEKQVILILIFNGFYFFILSLITDHEGTLGSHWISVYFLFSIIYMITFKNNGALALIIFYPYIKLIHLIKTIQKNAQ
jgi:hypothetical protein